MIDLNRRYREQIERVSQFSENAVASIAWIEKILSDTPIDDYRKLTAGLILSRYLTNVKKVGYDQAYTTIWQWLDKCAALKRLEASRRYFDHEVVKRQLLLAHQSRRLPMGLDTMKRDYHEVYKKLSVIA